MKKSKLTPLAMFALGGLITLIGCATAQKATEDTNKALQTAAAIVQTADKVVAQVQTISEDAQHLKDRASLITHYGRHTVVKGDSLWKISRKNLKTGFLWPMICEQNGLSNCNLIRPGDVIRYSSPELLATYSAAELASYRSVAYRAK